MLVLLVVVVVGFVVVGCVWLFGFGCGLFGLYLMIGFVWCMLGWWLVVFSDFCFFYYMMLVG